MKLDRRRLMFGASAALFGAAIGTLVAPRALVDPPSAEPVPQPVAPPQPRNTGSGLQDWVLNEDDVEALADLNGVPISRSLELLDNIDIPGAGDFHSERVGSIHDCVSACEADDNCNTFTFARLSHPLEEKRHMCWLKGERDPARLVDSIHYISGRRR